MLGITPATLRRWVDQGQVSAFVTPGGHRRFPRPVIEALLPRGRSARPPLSRLGASFERMARAYRRAKPPQPRPPASWMAELSGDERAELRERGNRLLAVVLEHLEGDASREALKLEEASAEAEDYGRRAAELGASLPEAVEAFLRFRSSFVGELAGIARRRNLDTREATGLLVAAEATMDRLLVALMAGHGTAA
jgi:DNA-binding transcriptional MerR regulator